MREGKLDLAIDEYLRLVDDQPGDVGAANALGDLYAKVGNRAAGGRAVRPDRRQPSRVRFHPQGGRLLQEGAQGRSGERSRAVAAGADCRRAGALRRRDALLEPPAAAPPRAEQRGRRRRVPGAPRRLSDRDGRREDGGGACRRRRTFAATEASRLWVDAADALERAGRAARGRRRADAGGQPRHRRRRAAAARGAWPARRPGRSSARGPFCRSRPPAISGDLLLALAGQRAGRGA